MPTKGRGQVVGRANRLSELRFWKERPRKLVGIGVKTEVLKKHMLALESGVEDWVLGGQTGQGSFVWLEIPYNQNHLRQ